MSGQVMKSWPTVNTINMELFKALISTIYLSLSFSFGDFVAPSLELNIYCLDHSSWSSLSQTSKSSAPNDFDGVSSISAKANMGYMFTVSFLYMSGAKELLKQITSHPHWGYSFNVTAEVIDRATQRRQLPKSGLKFSIMAIQLFSNTLKKNVFNPFIISECKCKNMSLKLLASAKLCEVCRNNHHMPQ